MKAKSNPIRDDPEQSKRFIDMAREIGADESDEGRKTFERIFQKVVPPPERKRRP
jgi:hypothetical protein